MSGGWTMTFEVELDPASAARQARFMVHDQLAGSVSAPFLSDVMLATSEVVTNAERYAPGPMWLSMHREIGSNRIRIGVADTSPELPHRDLAGAPLDPGAGRGLRIVDMIAAHWGVTPRDGGKEVWFEMVPGYHS